MNESQDPVTQAPVIDVRGVSKWFGSVVAVNDVTLQVYPGITGLLGPNGAGKSTILHMITGKSACSEGEVTVLGQPARDNPELYRSIGVMSEHESVYDLGLYGHTPGPRLGGGTDVGSDLPLSFCPPAWPSYRLAPR